MLNEKGGKILDGTIFSTGFTDLNIQDSFLLLITLLFF